MQCNFLFLPPKVFIKIVLPLVSLDTKYLDSLLLQKLRILHFIFLLYLYCCVNILSSICHRQLFSEKLSSVWCVNLYFFLGKQDWNSKNQLKYPKATLLQTCQNVYYYLRIAFFIYSSEVEHFEDDFKDCYSQIK
jgi:hypothetical protein